MEYVKKQPNGKKIMEEYDAMVQKCEGKFLIDDQLEMLVDSPQLPLAERYQCILNIFGELSKTYGLTNEFAKIQPVFQKHIDGLKQCGTAGSQDEIQLYV